MELFESLIELYPPATIIVNHVHEPVRKNLNGSKLQNKKSRERVMHGWREL